MRHHEMLQMSAQFQRETGNSRCRLADDEQAQGDVADQDSVERLIFSAVKEFGQIDVAVSNAAYSDRQRAYYPPPSPYFKDIRDKS